MCSGRACARIGVGYGALGQVINLPQWGLSCPSRWFRAPMLFVGFGRVPWWGWRPLGSLIGYGFGSVAGNGAACGGCGHAVGGLSQLSALPGAPREGTEAALVCASGAGARSACPSGSVFRSGNTLSASVWARALRAVDCSCSGTDTAGHTFTAMPPLSRGYHALQAL